MNQPTSIAPALARLPLVRQLCGAVAFLAVVLYSPPGSPASPDPRPVGPSAAEVKVLEQLSHWVLRGTEPYGRGDLASAVRARHRSFELFRSYAGAEVRRELVHELPFGALIWQAARRHGIDPLLLAAVVEAESGFDPRAVSVQGALGLMQLMPDTAALFSASADPLDPATNLELGARYLAALLEQFDGDLALALAAYNAGPGNVQRFAGVPPFVETRGYVRKVLASYVGQLQHTWRSTGDLDWLILES